MEFDKSRVYTALNAEDLPIGSKCIFSDTIQGLRMNRANAAITCLPNGDKVIKKTARIGFYKTWQAINGRGANDWDSNPDVWVIEFKIR